MGKLIAQFHERWKVAAPLLAKPGTRDGAEGVKLARICFAELPRMIDGRSLGAEDPNLITFILVVLFHIRKAGPQLRWVETQLARHLADLATVLPGARPHAAVWAMLREAVIAGTMTDHLSLQITRVLVDASSRLLGRLHVKTIELLICGVCNFETGPAAVAAQEVMFAEMLADLDALGSFDERHAGVRMNLAMFYNYHGMPERAGQVARALLDDPWMLNEAKRYRGMAFQFYREWAESCHAQGRLEEAEQGYRDAHAATIEEIEKGLGGRGHTIDALVRLEAVLREMHKDAEADQVAAEREDWIRDDLKGVGEIEDAILPE
ncbi:hypothetical protein B0T26DRAFT_699508 [Lasiosphaeria miniovina]|uniref:Uncharacterized protein n=1 Tax=Lasiosphaeria miniovina TaxID=1954250 RepID=A0AA40B700_9PEZI|nr:uncharacterized protein B0T26DRAFT_699508 [Lasiosphaeria miniovina]KAK0728851.1 hypothetical protein B0T26DRAFT_699508 [Lasiosphaeria miniovina]